jgi:Uma2 family endonuclease
MAGPVIEAPTLERVAPTADWEEQPVRKKMTYEEFLEWCDEDTWAEWVDGDVIVFSPAHRYHQDVSDFLVSVLRIYVEARNLGVVISAPFQMKMVRGREPDLLFIAWEHLDRLQETFLAGPADLVIEIISPDSLSRDWEDKFVEYESGGVAEYWLIDPERKQADFYVLDAEGHYQRKPVEAEGVYRSEVVRGFWLKEDWLWQEPLPSPVRVVAEVAGVGPALLEAFEQALRGTQNQARVESDPSVGSDGSVRSRPCGERRMRPGSSN